MGMKMCGKFFPDQWKEQEREGKDPRSDALKGSLWTCHFQRQQSPIP